MRDTPQQQLMSIWASTVRWWKNRVGNWSSRAAVDALDPETAKRIARDIGVDTNELRALAGKWPDSASLLERRMAAHRLDADAIEKAQPAVSRDLKKMCSLCRDKPQCEHDLDTASTDPAWQRYCPNSYTLQALIAERDARNSGPHS
jgi:hypothetical protein